MGRGHPILQRCGLIPQSKERQGTENQRRPCQVLRWCNGQESSRWFKERVIEERYYWKRLQSKLVNSRKAQS